MYLCDLHTHTLISPDSGALLPDMVRAAIAAGLDELCVTDHCDLLDFEGSPVTSFDWPAARAQYRTAKERLGDRLALRLGLELGSAVYDPPAARRILAGAGDELDFVLGSFHNWLGTHHNSDLSITDYTGDPALSRRAVESCLAASWTLVTLCPDCYDSLAHIVFPLRYIRRDGQNVHLADYEEQIRAILTQVARTGHAMELNTYRGQTLEEWRPLLRWFRECGGELVTVGSDAHAPEHVAKGVPAALELLREAGFRHIATFEKRSPVLHVI